MHHPNRTALIGLVLLGVPACGGAPTTAAGPVVDLSAPAPKPTTTAEPAPEDPDYRCEGTAFKVNGRDYCAYPMPRTWSSARQACKTAGGDLASFDGPDEAHDVFVAMGPPIGAAEAVWFGLNEPKKGQWTWLDGTPLSDPHWNKGEPNDDGGHEDCAEWKLGPGLWNDAPCDAARPYVCEQATSADGTKVPMRCSGQQIHTTLGDYCFHLRQKKNFADAETACESESARLAVLSSPQENKLLHDAVGPKVNVSSLWIGYTDARYESLWVWVSDAPTRVARWKDGEPNDFQGDEDCAEWFPEDGLMNDLRCTEKRPYLCEHGPPQKLPPDPPRRHPPEVDFD